MSAAAWCGHRTNTCATGPKSLPATRSSRPRFWIGYCITFKSFTSTAGVIVSAISMASSAQRPKGVLTPQPQEDQLEGSEPRARESGCSKTAGVSLVLAHLASPAFRLRQGWRPRGSVHAAPRLGVASSVANEKGALLGAPHHNAVLHVKLASERLTKVAGAVRFARDQR